MAEGSDKLNKRRMAEGSDKLFEEENGKRSVQTVLLARGTAKLQKRA
jgi:hypothetical protein